MHYRSTRDRGEASACSLSEALSAGLAPDGGLFVPVSFPKLNLRDFDGCESVPDVAAKLLAPFFAGDALASALDDICREAFDFDVVLRPVRGADGIHVLELFHGPTAAFKDFGAKFLAAAFGHMPATGIRTVLVATSGDTGGAVAAAFHRKPGFRVVVLYPDGAVSPRQEQQLTCWGDNVHAVSVKGVFDDCQRLVKAASSDPALRESLQLTSANSINIGRLLPQMCYYAWASLRVTRAGGGLAGFVVPTGNLGNATAAFWTRHVGLPIGPIVLATNENRVIPEFIATGEWKPAPSRATLATAMDVGNPSNMERLRSLYESDSALRADVQAYTVSDSEIENEIRMRATHDEILCPHTATGFHVVHRLGNRPGGWIVAATAHPAKFETVVEPLIGRAVPVPPALAKILEWPSHKDDMPVDENAFFDYLRQFNR